MWALLPRDKITSGFFRIQMLVALGLLVLATLTAGGLTVPPEGGTAMFSATVSRVICGVLAGVAYVGSVLWMLERRRAGTICGFVILAGTWFLLVAGRDGMSPLAGESTLWLSVLAETASAAVVGGSVTAMLLGHWYLTATGMSLTPLVRANLLFGGMVLMRAVLAGIALAASWELVVSQTQILWLSLRWLAGILGPLAGVVMVQRILLLRNTQSATGVLFAAVILVFIGELSASLLELELSRMF